MNYFTLYYSLNIVKIAYIVSMVTKKQNIVLHNFFLHNLIELILKYSDIFIDLIESSANKFYLALKMTYRKLSIFSF